MNRFPLHVIPVLDIQAGQVVHAVGGKRQHYRPIQSPLVAGCDPVEIAQALADRVGHQEIYVADLEALAGAPPQWSVVAELAERGFHLWLDVGIANALQLGAAIDSLGKHNSACRLIVALETLESIRNLEVLASDGNARRLAFSLDLRDGKPIAKCPSLRSQTPINIVQQVEAAGVQRVIVLDVGAVGTAAGPTVLQLCRCLHEKWPHVQLITGGGVRCEQDLHALASAGCTAAMSATWLHNLGTEKRPHF